MLTRSPWKPVPEDVILEGLNLLLDRANYPIAIMCGLGRHQTGTLVGCLRKLQGWNLTSILEEYRRYAGTKQRQLNEQFIELFDIDLVEIPKCPPSFLHGVVISQDDSRQGETRDGTLSGTGKRHHTGKSSGPQGAGK